MFWCRRQVVTGVSSRRPGFNPGLFHKKFLVDKNVTGKIYKFFDFFFTRFHLKTSESRCKSGRNAGSFKRWSCLLGEKRTKENNSNLFPFASFNNVMYLTLYRRNGRKSPGCLFHVVMCTAKCL